MNHLFQINKMHALPKLFSAILAGLFVVGSTLAQTEHPNDTTGPSPDMVSATAPSFVFITFDSGWIPEAVGNSGHVLIHSDDEDAYKRWHWGEYGQPYQSDNDEPADDSIWYDFTNISNSGTLIGNRFIERDDRRVLGLTICGYSDIIISMTGKTSEGITIQADESNTVKFWGFPDEPSDLIEELEPGDGDRFDGRLHFLNEAEDAAMGFAYMLRESHECIDGHREYSLFGGRRVTYPLTYSANGLVADFADYTVDANNIHNGTAFEIIPQYAANSFNSKQQYFGEYRTYAQGDGFSDEIEFGYFFKDKPGNEFTKLSFTPGVINEAGLIAGRSGSNLILYDGVPHSHSIQNGVSAFAQSMTPGYADEPLQILSGNGLLIQNSYDDGSLVPLSNPEALTAFTTSNIIPSVPEGWDESSIRFLDMSDNGVFIVGYGDYTDPQTSQAEQRAVLLVKVDMSIIARDPHSGEAFNPGALVHESEPVPEVLLEVTSATISASGELQISVTCETRDVLGEVSNEGADLVTFYINGQEVESVSVFLGDNTQPFWQPNGTVNIITTTLTVPSAREGVYVVRAQSGLNGAMNSGWDTATVIVDANSSPDSWIFTPDGEYDIDFGDSVSTSVLTTVEGEPSPKGFLEPFAIKFEVPDSLVENLTGNDPSLIAKVGGQTVTLIEAPDVGETVPSGVTYLYVADGDQAQLFAAVRELGIAPAGLFTEGFIRASIHMKSDDSLILERYFSLVPSVNSEGGGPITTVAALQASIFQPPSFAQTAASSSTSAENYSIDLVILYFELLTAGFGEKLLNDYRNAGLVVKLEDIGNLYEWTGLRNTWTTRKMLPVHKLDPQNVPELIIDSDLDNALQAAVALYNGLLSLEGAWVRDDIRLVVLNNNLDDFILNSGDFQAFYQAWQTGSLGAVADALSDVALAGEIGVSIAAEPADYVLSAAAVSDHLSEGEYAQAGLTGLFAVLPGVSGKLGSELAKRGKVTLRMVTGSNIEITSQAVLDALLETADKANRIERMDILRPLIQSGEISSEMVDKLREAGLLKIAIKDPNRSISWNYFLHLAENFRVSTGATIDWTKESLHHMLPVEFDNIFLRSGIDINSAQWGQVLPKRFHFDVLHYAGDTWGPGGPWNYQWREFFRADPIRTQLEVESFLDSLLDLISDQTKSLDKISWPYEP